MYRIQSSPVLVILLLSGAITACSASAPKPPTGPAPARTSAAITPADVRSRIYLIADDSMAGRAAGERGNFVMTAYLAGELARLGLQPGGDKGSWFQTIPMVRRSVDSASALEVGGQPVGIFTDFLPIRPTSTVRFATSLPTASYRTVYGGRAGDTTVALTNGDVAGRIVILDAALGANGRPNGVDAIPAGRAIAKYPAAAAIFITGLDFVTPATATFLRGRANGLSGVAPATIHTPLGVLISGSTATRIFGRPVSSLRPGTVGSPVTASIKFTEIPVNAPARNVIGIVRGSDPLLRNEYVQIGAHSDHIGVAARPVDHDSLHIYNGVMRPNGADTRIPVASTPTAAQWIRIRAMIDSVRRIRPARLDSVYNGADDDGSGSVALLEIAESLASRQRPRRSILLIWHTAEESGLLGSAWYAEHTTVPHDSI
ncbi:MAG: M28 family peptidase, partial [Gemmatimonadaceae bacterium]